MSEEPTEEMKAWFGNGEADVDLMIRLGVVSNAQIVAMWNECTDSPGFTKRLDVTYVCDRS